jgi:membrane protease YdiL (CAAX protease family)
MIFMEQTPTEVIFANLASMVLWILAVAVILVAGQRSQSIRGFRDKMIAQWKPSLTIAVLFVIGMGLGGWGFLNPHGVTLFCQSLIGLTLARSITGYEPLSVIQSLIQRERVWRSIGLMIGIALIVVLPVLIIGSVGLSIGHQLLGETNRSAEAMGMLPSNKWLTFFLLLSGAGIAEETTYRLVFLSLFWRVMRRRWLAIILSAVVFGAYHLTPLNGMYRVFWQFPISQFLASTLIGIVWGYVFVKRGYETTVLGHTLSDWIPFMLFSAG